MRRDYISCYEIYVFNPIFIHLYFLKILLFNIIDWFCSKHILANNKIFLFFN